LTSVRCELCETAPSVFNQRAIDVSIAPIAGESLQMPTRIVLAVVRFETESQVVLGSNVLDRESRAISAFGSEALEPLSGFGLLPCRP
jgi:hypothetical protein